MNFFKNLWFLIKTKKFFAPADRRARQIIARHQASDHLLVERLAPRKIPSWRQLRYWRKLLSPREKFWVKLLTGVGLICVLILLINNYFGATKIAPATGGEYTEGVIGYPRLVNPLFASANPADQDLTALIYNGLLRFDGHGALVPDLAEKYSLSSDQKTYSFTLKKNILWHDGEKFDANDVIYTFDQIKDAQSQSPLYFSFKNVKVEKTDDFTVRFILTQPFAPFRESLTTGILPRHAWSQIAPNAIVLNELNQKPIGTGPYRFEALTRDGKTGQIRGYRLAANKNYFHGRPWIDYLNFKFYGSASEAADALGNRNIEGLGYLPIEERQNIVNDRSLNFLQLKIPEVTALFFNRKGNSLLKDATIRKLLAHALDKNELARDVLAGQARAIDGPILPDALGFSADYPKYPFNPEYAKTELEKAGWKLTPYKIAGDEKASEYPFLVRKKGADYLEFDLTAVNQGEFVKLAEAIQKAWQIIGVKTNLNIIQPENIQTDIIRPRNYQILLYGEIGGLDPDPYAFWHSSQATHPGLNLALFANAEADKLLTTARTTNDEKTRVSDYAKFQKIVAADAPAIFLYQPNYLYPQTKKIKNNLTSNIIIPANRFANVNDWYIKTKRELQ
jgi:peptide/nickel transport system substrate-binding protein